MTLLNKLFNIRDLGLISFREEETSDGKKPVGDIQESDLWAKIRVAFGGMSLSEVAMLSRHSTGIAVTPVFGRPRERGEKLDVFVLMPFKAKMEWVYTNHIKKIGDELGLVVKDGVHFVGSKGRCPLSWSAECSHHQQRRSYTADSHGKHQRFAALYTQPLDSPFESPHLLALDGLDEADTKKLSRYLKQEALVNIMSLHPCAAWYTTVAMITPCLPNRRRNSRLPRSPSSSNLSRGFFGIGNTNQLTG